MKLAEYRLISKAINDDLAAVFKKHGLEMRPFGAKVDERGGLVRMTIEAADLNHKDAQGNATNPERELYKSSAYVFDLKPEWLDQPFKMGGRTYSIVGMRRRGQKCINIKRDDDKVFICTPEQVRVYFLAQAKAKAS